MPESYSQSAVRHFDDADKLAAASALHGAGYLVGYAAECAIKHAVEVARTSADVPRVHLPDLIERSKMSFIGRRHQLMRVALKMPSLMAGWSTDLRYAANGAVAQATFDAWQRMLIASWQQLGSSEAKYEHHV